MKAFTLAAGLILATASVVGQTQQNSDERPCISNSINVATANIQNAKRNYLWTLQSDNDGVVESALAYVVQLRIILPREDMKAIESVVGDLALNGPTPVIRYKAYLATQVFANPQTFCEVASANYASSDQFFSALGLRLQQTMLGYSSH